MIYQKREYDINEKKLSAVKAETKIINALNNKEIFDMVYGQSPDKRKKILEMISEKRCFTLAYYTSNKGGRISV